MPVGSPSVLTANTSPTDASSYVTASFTPTAGRTLFAFVEGMENPDSSGTWAIANSHAGTWSWSAITTSNTTNDNMKMGLFWATVPNSPGSGTVTFSRTTTMYGAGWCIFEVADGYIPATPNKASAPFTATAAPSIDLPSAPLSTSLLISAVGNDTSQAAGITPGSGWTELDDRREDGHHVQFQIQYRTGTTSTTASWSGCSSSAGDKQSTLVVEILETPALSGSVTETAEPDDAHAGTMQMAGAVTETVDPADSLAGAMGMSGLVDETAAPADTLVDGPMTMAGLIIETVDITDVIVGEPSAPALSDSLAETVGIVDTFVSTMHVVGSASETIPIADAYLGSMGFNQFVQEIVVITDSILSGGLAPPVFQQQACLLQQVTLRGRSIRPH